MKSDRRHQLASNALARELEGFPFLIKQHANTILTVILAILAVVMLIRWRMNVAENNRLQALNDLAGARSSVEMLRNPNLSMQPPAYIAGLRKASLASNQAIANLLNGSADDSVKSQALITRGDLYWQLANFPELPGATTQPDLRLPESKEALLTKSAEAYEEVLKSDAYRKSNEAGASAHLGLAAIYQNRGDWDNAKKHLEFVTSDTSASSALVDLAKSQLADLPMLANKMYLSPPTSQPIESTAPPALPTLGAMGPALPATLPDAGAVVGSSAPTSQPATKPGT